MSTKAVKVCCQGCGADLQLADDIRFLTCNFCGSRLEVVRDPTTTHTRLLDELHRKTEVMEGKIHIIELQNELELLDRNWDRYRESCLTRDKDGTLSEPSLAAAQVIGYGSLIIAGVILLLCLFNWNSGGILIGLIVMGGFIIFGVFNLIHGTETARSYEGTKLTYQLRRSTLLKTIQKARNNR
jgi:hypothetical protein